jgi:4-coumarate--CoA ligase (photoactive yellow protein activation family)
LANSLLAQGLARLTQVYGSSETAGIGTRHAALAPYELMPFWTRDDSDDTQLLRSKPDGSVCVHPIQDRLAWQGAREFRVCGRLDEAVQVGGTNVFPSQVRQVLLGCPQVADAAVRPMAAAEGSRLKAFIVPVLGADLDALRIQLWAWADAHLRAPARPKAYSLGERLPRNAMGKPADWPIGPLADNDGTRS